MRPAICCRPVDGLFKGKGVATYSQTHWHAIIYRVTPGCWITRGTKGNHVRGTWPRKNMTIIPMQPFPAWSNRVASVGTKREKQDISSPAETKQNTQHNPSNMQCLA